MTTTYTNHKGIKSALTNPPIGEQIEVKDANSKGLYLRIQPTGNAAFIHRYKVHGVRRVFTLLCATLNKNSTERQISEALASARAIHAAQKAEIKAGNDPAIERDLNTYKINTVPTVSEFADTYITRWAKKKKKSWAEDQRILNVDVLPYIGGLKVDAVEKKHVHSLLDRKEEAGALVARNRLLSLLHKFFNFAIERGEIPNNINPAAKITKEEETARARVLSENEIRTLWAATSETSNLDHSTRLAIRLRLITGQRSIEIVNAKNGDIEGDVWMMDDTKNGLPHAIPLTPMAVQVIEEARILSGNGLLFPARNGGVMAVQVLSKVFERIDWGLNSGEIRPTPHDLRRTLRTGLGALNFDNFIQRRVTNHKEKNQLDETYNRWQYMDEKRKALEAWDRRLTEIITGDAPNVIPFRRTA